MPYLLHTTVTVNISSIAGMLGAPKRDVRSDVSREIPPYTMRDKYKRVGNLQTFSLEEMSVPDAVVKDWRRRQHALKALQATTPEGNQPPVTQKEAGGNMSTIETAAMAAAAAAGGRNVPVASRAPSSLAHQIYRIKNLAPSDERGMWLLNNLLEQVRQPRTSLCTHVVRTNIVLR